MKIFQSITFRDESVRLDGKHFLDCVFENCTLEYSGGDVILERTALYGCRHVLYGYARQTANYMRMVGICDATPNKWTEYTGAIN